MAKSQPSNSRSAARGPGVAVQIGIDARDRAAIVDGLSKRLADTYTLYLTNHPPSAVLRDGGRVRVDPDGHP